MNEFWLCFVPLFVAVDPFGVLPIFIGLSRGLDAAATRRLIARSALAALGVALGFLAVGHLVLWLLGITVADFMVAGGIVLFALALGDLLSANRGRQLLACGELGVVPLGVPLITGPAVLTTSMLLLERYGAAPTAAALVANVLLAALVFSFARRVNALLGAAGAQIVSKIAMLLLAAIAVMMVRQGIGYFVPAAAP